MLKLTCKLLILLTYTGRSISLKFRWRENCINVYMKWVLNIVEITTSHMVHLTWKLKPMAYHGVGQCVTSEADSSCPIPNYTWDNPISLSRQCWANICTIPHPPSYPGPQRERHHFGPCFSLLWLVVNIITSLIRARNRSDPRVEAVGQMPSSCIKIIHVLICTLLSLIHCCLQPLQR